jgi:Zn-dependent M28 family amino/carboxypeptidase
MPRTVFAAPALLAACLALAPRGGSGQALQALDSARLLSDVAVLAHDSMQGRAPGTPGSLRARTFLERALRETGARPLGAGFTRPFEWPRGSGVNLVASVQGRGSADHVIVLTAHFDHVGIREGEIFNGADDNASGTAAVLELTRRIVADPLEHTLIVALFDAEEVGSQGARAFVSDPPIPLERIALNVNLDMVSRTAGLLWAGGASHTPSLRPVLERVAAGAPVTLRLGHDTPNAPEGDDWTQLSDHAVFHARGIPFVYFGVEDHVDYHRPTDDFERIDPGELVAAVRTILLGLRELDAALPLATERPR